MTNCCLEMHEINAIKAMPPGERIAYIVTSGMIDGLSLETKEERDFIERVADAILFGDTSGTIMSRRQQKRRSARELASERLTM